MSGINLSQAWGGVCGGTDFLYSENFNLQEVTITFWGNVDEMSMYFDMVYNYTIDVAAGNIFVIMTSGNEL
jgi:hypothetical protein